jgi:hypothetical protein
MIYEEKKIMIMIFMGRTFKVDKPFDRPRRRKLDRFFKATLNALG